MVGMGAGLHYVKNQNIDLAQCSLVSHYGLH